ncbi:MAGa7180 family putative nuclease [Mycoplasma sp. 332]|uniref:MAGa7180 family putative nuclease n=1 Tax=unclassified Asterococcus (in: mycoplasmas, genus) TaxID=3407551 RepID=UPI003F65E4F7
MNEEKKIIIPNRLHYNGNQYVVDHETKTVKLTAEYHKNLLSKKPGEFGGFRKITGSALGDILKLTQFNSPFAAFARIANFRFPVLDPKYVNAGVILEPKILEKIEKSFNLPIQRFPAEKFNYDYFKNNVFFGGLPDGYIAEKKMIIEIKTVGSKKLESWKQGMINVAYLKQAQLYSYLMGAKHFAIIACFLEEEDYKDPNLVDINNRVVKGWPFEVNEEQVLDDMAACKKWYDKYTKLGISPTWNNSIDVDIVKYLECKNYDEWKKLYLEWVNEGKAVAEYEK